MINEGTNSVEIFTDGSCHSQLFTGAWVAIVLHANNKFVISGTQENTTHNRMELLAVINAIKFALENMPDQNICIYTDSQYVSFLPQRYSRLTQTSFKTKAGNTLVNSDLIIAFYHYTANKNVSLQKVKAHQKKSSGVNYNTEADLLARKIVREKVKQNQAS